MLAKLITAVALFAISFSVQAEFVPAVVTENIIENSSGPVITYERVFRDGQWWIIIYEDGEVIAEFLDSEQD